MENQAEITAAESEPGKGSNPAPKRQRRKVQHKCDACGSVFARRLDCFAHMDSCEEIKRKLQNQRAVAPQWAVLFETNAGMTHPIRYRAQQGESLTWREVNAAARKYMMEKHPDWLVKITDIYPVED